MIIRIKDIYPQENYRLLVAFDDGKTVYYDMTEDMRSLPGYDALENGLFAYPQLDESRTCVFWNDEIDLPSDILYEYGEESGDAADDLFCIKLLEEARNDPDNDEYVDIEDFAKELGIELD